jgi:hypothetical protein
MLEGIYSTMTASVGKTHQLNLAYRTADRNVTCMEAQESGLLWTQRGKRATDEFTDASV